VPDFLPQNGLFEPGLAGLAATYKSFSKKKRFMGNDPDI
jgi:hypothetical protein